MHNRVVASTLALTVLFLFPTQQQLLAQEQTQAQTTGVATIQLSAGTRLCLPEGGSIRTATGWVSLPKGSCLQVSSDTDTTTSLPVILTDTATTGQAFCPEPAHLHKRAVNSKEN